MRRLIELVPPLPEVKAPDFDAKELEVRLDSSVPQPGLAFANGKWNIEECGAFFDLQFTRSDAVGVKAPATPGCRSSSMSSG
jgi:hypothetical protein